MACNARLIPPKNVYAQTLKSLNKGKLKIISKACKGNKSQAYTIYHVKTIATPFKNSTEFGMKLPTMPFKGCQNSIIEEILET